MKVLHILYSGLGGHGSVFFSIVNGDEAHELTHEALFFGIEDVRKEYIIKSDALGITWHALKKKPGLDLSSYIKMARIIRQARPDIVLLHSSTYIIPAIIARYSLPLRRFKIISTESQANHLKRNIEWLGLWIVMLVANRIVLLTASYKNELKKKLGLFFQTSKISIIPNGIDLDIFKPQVTPVATNGIVIGMQSRLSSIKDHATLLRAIALIKKTGALNPIDLFIAGQGESLGSLQKLAQELDIEKNVHFTGLLPETELPRFINKLDIYVHATLGETMSTAIMQVMACKKPIIASDVCGVNNMLIDEQNALLVPVKDPEALSAAIIRLVNTPLLANSIAEKAFEIAQASYSNKLMFKRYKQAFTQVVV